MPSERASVEKSGCGGKVVLHESCVLFGRYGWRSLRSSSGDKASSRRASTQGGAGTASAPSASRDQPAVQQCVYGPG